MTFLNLVNSVKKPLLISIIICSVLIISPQKTSAQYAVVAATPDADAILSTIAVSTGISATTDTIKETRETVLNGIAWFIAKQIVQQLTAQTVNWINSGFQGNPAYVTDPQQFFLNIGDSVASKFLSETNLSKLCSPFRAQVRLALVTNYLSDSNSQNYSCTLSKIKDNFDAFTQDFSQGGWDGWFEMTQNSQNNPYGSYLNAQNDLAIQMGTQRQIYKNQLDWGQGFLSYEKCTSYATYDIYGDGNFDPAKPPCLAKETITPGSVIENQLNHLLPAGADQLNAADSINEIVGALLTQLVGKVVGGIGNGLRGASN